jgi:hypothetical protein
MPSGFESHGYLNRVDRRSETLDESMFQQKLDRRFEDAFGNLSLGELFPPLLYLTRDMRNMIACTALLSILYGANI